MKQFIIICVLIFSFLECYSQAPEDTVHWEMTYDPSEENVLFPFNTNYLNIIKIDNIYFLPSYVYIPNNDPKLYLFEFDETGDYLRLIETNILGYPSITGIDEDRIKIITFAARANKLQKIVFNKEYKVIGTVDLSSYSNDNSESKQFFFNIDNNLSFIGSKAERPEQYMNILDESGNVIDRFEILIYGESLRLYMNFDKLQDLHQSNSNFAFDFKVAKDSTNIIDKGYFRRIVKYDENYNYLSHKDFGDTYGYSQTETSKSNINGEILLLYDSDKITSSSHQIKFQLINNELDVISEAEYSYGYLADYNYQLLDDGSFIFYYYESSDIEKDGILSQIIKFSKDCQKEWEINNYLIHENPSDGDTGVQILDDLLIMYAQELKPANQPNTYYNSTFVIRAYRLISTSVHDAPIFDSSLLYPNPYSNGGRLSIKSDNLALPGNAEIYDLSGRLIATVYAISRSDTSYDLKMPPLFAGSFVLKLNFAGSFESYPFVVE